MRIKFSIQQDYWYFYIVGLGKTGPAHSSPPPPPKCLDLSIYCLVFRFMLLFDCIWTILNDLFQREIKFLNQKVNLYFYIVGWGKTGSAHSFPPPKCWDLSIYPLDFWIMLFFCCIWTLLTYTKQRIKFFKPTSLFVVVGWGKTGPAHSFPPP